MGLFGRWAKKKRDKAAAEPKAQAMAATMPPAEAVRREVTPKARVNPDQPGWGMTIGQEIAKAREGRSSQQ